MEYFLTRKIVRFQSRVIYVWDDLEIASYVNRVFEEEILGSKYVIKI